MVHVETTRTEAAASPAPHRPKILLIDDEPLHNRSMRRMLVARNEVQTTTDPREALGWIAAGQRFDVILCDMTMAGMTGVDVVEELRKLAPDQAKRLAFLAAGDFSRWIQERLPEADVKWLEKPFSPLQLSELIERMMAEGPKNEGG
jgi:CheY-like chemotaxis protein